MGQTIDDKELAMTVLASLPEEFKPLLKALDAVGEDNLSYEKVKAMLLNDADRANNTKSKKCEDAFSVRGGRRFYTSLQGKKETGGNNEGKYTGISFCGTCHFC